MMKLICPRVLSVLVSTLVIGGACGAQVAPGLRLFGPYNGTDTYLVDTNGNIVQTWKSELQPSGAVYQIEDGSLLRAVKLPGGPSIGGVGGGVQRVGLHGDVLWDFHYDGPQHWSHHDLEPMPGGTVLLIAWDNKTVAEALAAGRDPALIQGQVMRPDSVIEILPTGPTTGTIVWEWHIWDHLVQEVDPTAANYGSVAAHPELVDINYPPVASNMNDWNHMNSVKYDAVHDRIILSARTQNEIWVIDHSTTTAEAAGHTGGLWGKGGDILYRYGNPECYQAGTSADRVFFGQHSARCIPPGYPGAGNFTVFNNTPPGATSTVWEFTPPMDAAGNFILSPGAAYGPSGPVWTFSHPLVQSTFMSSAERLPNGNTLICSALQGAVFEVTPAGSAVWASLLDPGTLIFQAHYIDRNLWADRTSVSASTGGSVRFDAIFGTPLAGMHYYLLASASGTTPGIPVDGITFPLNFDEILEITYTKANSSTFIQTSVTLDALGRAQSTVNFSPGLTMPAQVHFAGAVYDPTLGTFVAATNPVLLTITP